jgi:hypothetical protein
MRKMKLFETGKPFLFLKKACFFVLLSWILIPLVDEIHAQQVQTLLSQDSIRIGDPFRITLIVSSSPEYPEVKLPASDYFKGDLLEMNRQRFKVSTYLDSIVLDVQYFSVSDTVLAGIPIQFYGNGRDTVITSARIPLFFQSIVPDSTQTGELRPIKPIFEFERPLWHYLLLLGILVLAGIAGWWFWRKWQQAQRKEPEPVKTPPLFIHPAETLLTTIEGLSSQVDRLTKEDFGPFYVELGNAIRRYMEEVYGFEALEMTSFEIIRSLQSYHAHESLVKASRTVLREADQVKFARFFPTREMARHALDTAREFYTVASREDHYRIQQMKAEFEAVSQDAEKSAEVTL